MQSRRSFFRTCIGAAIAVTAAGRMTFQPELHPPKVRWNPKDYCGDFRWINLGAPPTSLDAYYFRTPICNPKPTA